MQEKRKERAFINTSIRVAGSVVTLVAQMLAMIVLCRLVPVEAHGTVAFAVIAVSLADRASQLGVGPALVQCEELTLERIRVAFTISLFMGAAAWLTLSFFVPLFFIPGPRITVLRILSLNFAFMGVSIVSGAILQREHRFKEIVLAETSAFAIGHLVVGIGMAWLGFGIWSLVAAILTNTALRSAFLWMRTRHSLTPLFRMDEARQLLRFGSVLTLTQLLNFGATSSDRFIVGLGGDYPLGLYEKAIQLIRLPSRLISRSVNAVLLPILSRVDDPVAVRRGFFKSVMLATSFMVPIAVVAFVAAPELVEALLGASFLGVVTPLKILAPVAVLTTYTLGDAVLVSKNKLRAQLTIHATFFVSIIGLCLSLFHFQGMPGVAIGVLAANSIAYTMMMTRCCYLLGGSWGELIRCQTPAVTLFTVCLLLSIACRWLIVASLTASVYTLLVVEVCAFLCIFAFVFLLPIPGPHRECQELAFQYADTMVGRYPFLNRFIQRLQALTMSSVKR